ncbi:hypothetical protein CTM45_04770 [Prevotella intermedia]|uniref:Uncharacterized protein n=1 Tax=Prevotella intermedia TaxID=28131 RepID=A0A2D3LKG7_PREIN|nr:hypothetical protein CTM46_06325 [Prevotella intermedia]ATV55493.1 hypothetical protein CTM61_08685 [Prevotella intermedia]PJI22658.1 hypothetical protein CTM45_04770 [Prevotella intermedia]
MATVGNKFSSKKNFLPTAGKFKYYESAQKTDTVKSAKGDMKTKNDGRARSGNGSSESSEVV